MLSGLLVSARGEPQVAAQALHQRQGGPAQLSQLTGGKAFLLDFFFSWQPSKHLCWLAVVVFSVFLRPFFRFFLWQPSEHLCWLFVVFSVFLTCLALESETERSPEHSRRSNTQGS